MNMGLGGTGPNSTLRFTEIFNFNELLPPNNKKGAFIFDFHAFVVQRVIGSKSFLAWGQTTPRYVLNDEKIPVYKGPWAGTLQAKFFEFLGHIPYSATLFPDLPRIGEEHIDLVARIFLEMKKTYLAQTSPDNKFIVFINPEYPDPRPLKYRNDPDSLVRYAMEKRLKELGIEVVLFKDDEVLDIDHFPMDGHISPEGHKKYAEMIYLKLKDKI